MTGDNEASQNGVTIQQGFPEPLREAAAALFWESFSGKLGVVLGPESKALELIARTMDPTHAFSAIGSSGELLGIGGFKTCEAALVDGGLREMAST